MYKSELLAWRQTFWWKFHWNPSSRSFTVSLKTPTPPPPFVNHTIFVRNCDQNLSIWSQKLLQVQDAYWSSIVCWNTFCRHNCCFPSVYRFVCPSVCCLSVAASVCCFPVSLLTFFIYFNIFQWQWYYFLPSYYCS